MMKKRKNIKEKIEYYSNCPYCKREIKGSAESQVEYNMDIHIKAKHKEISHNHTNEK
jgi:hypothetical protein